MSKIMNFLKRRRDHRILDSGNNYKSSEGGWGTFIILCLFSAICGGGLGLFFALETFSEQLRWGRVDEADLFGDSYRWEVVGFSIAGAVVGVVTAMTLWRRAGRPS